MKSSILDGVEAALPGLMSAARAWLSARQWVNFYRRMGQDRIDFLEGQAHTRHWCDRATLGLAGRLRRRLEACVRSYRNVLGSADQGRCELDGRETAALGQVQQLLSRVEDARRREEARQAEEARQRLREALGATEEPNRSGTTRLPTNPMAYRNVARNNR